MKKIISLLVSAILSISLLAGCTNNNVATDKDKEEIKVEQNKESDKESDKEEDTTKDTTNKSSNKSESTNTNSFKKTKSSDDAYIKDGTHLGEEGKRQDEGTAYDPSQDIEDNNKDGAMDSEDGIIRQYNDENGNLVIEYENGDIVTKYND